MQKSSRPGPRTIQTIARDGMPQARQVRPDLVRASGPDSYFEVSKSFKAAPHAVIRERLAPVAELRGHTRAANRVPRDRLADAAGLSAHLSLNQREIRFLHRTRGELRGQRAMRRVGAGHQQHAAGTAIQAVNNARAQLAAD